MAVEVIAAHKDGKVCRACETHKPASAFAMRRSGARQGHLVAHCKECVARANRMRNDDAKRENPALYQLVERKSKLKRSYGITLADYYKMLSEQGGGCGICGVRAPGKRTKNFAVDHCHETGNVRGLLCHKCNRALGLMQDSPLLLEVAAAYLKGEEPWR